MFDDYAQLNPVADGPVGTVLFRKLEGKGIVGLAHRDNGFKP
jgi:TRAP-type C4-dicarboxylate transport system substrate-binding protein